MADISGWQTFRDRVVTLSGKKNPSVRDFVEFSKRARISEFNVFVGSPKTVVDEMEKWFTEGGCDGFVLSPTHMPGGYEDFVRMVVPELQRRGLVRTEYETTTLRGHLGLEAPKSGDWKLESGPKSKAAADKGVKSKVA